MASPIKAGVDVKADTTAANNPRRLSLTSGNDGRVCGCSERANADILLKGGEFYSGLKKQRQNSASKSDQYKDQTKQGLVGRFAGLGVCFLMGFSFQASSRAERGGIGGSDALGDGCLLLLFLLFSVL